MAEIVLKWPDIVQIVQMGAIIATLLFTMWQWRKTRKIIKIDNYSKIISALNNLRDIRMEVPDLERSLFKARELWSDRKIRRRVYGVELANIFELAFLSHKEGLIGEKGMERLVFNVERSNLKR